MGFHLFKKKKKDSLNLNINPPVSPRKNNNGQPSGFDNPNNDIPPPMQPSLPSIDRNAESNLSANGSQPLVPNSSGQMNPTNNSFDSDFPNFGSDQPQFQQQNTNPTMPLGEQLQGNPNFNSASPGKNNNGQLSGSDNSNNNILPQMQPPLPSNDGNTGINPGANMSQPRMPNPSGQMNPTNNSFNSDLPNFGSDQPQFQQQNANPTMPSREQLQSNPGMTQEDSVDIDNFNDFLNKNDSASLQAKTSHNSGNNVKASVSSVNNMQSNGSVSSNGSKEVGIYSQGTDDNYDLDSELADLEKSLNPKTDNPSELKRVPEQVKPADEEPTEVSEETITEPEKKPEVDSAVEGVISRNGNIYVEAKRYVPAIERIQQAIGFSEHNQLDFNVYFRLSENDMATTEKLISTITKVEDKLMFIDSKLS